MAYTTINKSTDYFNTVTYTGNGGTQTISGVGFQPDFSWVKGRDYAYYHYLQDAVRGSQKILYTNNTDAEATITAGISAWNADGYVTGSQGALNYSGRTFVAWNWLANGAGSTNYDGSITSTVSANTTSGFSIVKYTAGGSSAVSTIGHGLNAVPKMIIVKGTDSNSSPDQWMVYHEALGNTKRIKLNSTDASATGSGYWNNTTPTSSLFTVGSSSEGNSANGIYIAYCFAEKQGYSKFGSYTGNGNADGTFVYTGFKPAFVMVKKTSGADAWQMTDHKRDANVSPNFARVLANDTQAEATNTTWARIDKFSNGFKLGGTDSVSNENGSSYIYMAFAEEPLVGDNPATAR